MFDMSKLGDLASMAREAKTIQDKQERLQREQIDLLKKISGQIETVISLLKK